MPEPEFELNHFLPYLLNQAAEVSSLSFQTMYKERYGMLRTEWRVLFHLGLYGQMTAREICQSAKMHKTKISRAVHRLTERRFVSRTRDQNDRRMEHLNLTKSGRAAYDDLRKIAEQHQRKLLEGLSAQEQDTLRRALIKLADGPSHGFT